MTIDPVLAVKTAYPDADGHWNEADVILYHLGLGAGSSSDGTELAYVYERELKVLPTFSVIPAFEAVRPAVQGPGLDYKLSRMLHGEQELTVHNALPGAGSVVSSASVEAVYDKGSAAVAVLKAETRTNDGLPLCTNRFRLFIRGEGGFEGDPGPTSKPWEAGGAELLNLSVPTSPQQAAIYRLSGDRNPLHIDPAFARKAGFDRPILHGLCTYGLVCKAIVDRVLDGDPAMVKSWSARFVGSVYPGETIRIEAWQQDGGIAVQASVDSRSQLVLGHGWLETN
jgi:acyl dehydratase